MTRHAWRHSAHRPGAEVVQAAGARITAMRSLVLDYAAQHQLADGGTGLVDIGWTGRMAGSFIELCESAGMGRPDSTLLGARAAPGHRLDGP